MSDLQPDPADLPRPLPPLSWRERLAGWAEAFDLTPGRLFVGLAMLAVGGFLAWRMLAPAPLPPEMELPFVSTTVPTGGPSGSGGAGAEDTASPGGRAATDAAAAATPAGSTDLTEVVVHVAGAVVAPGVQRLPSGARVIDAVDAAGGAAGDAELARINLAAPLEDGQQIYVPRLGELVPPAAVGGDAAGTETTSGDSGAAGSTAGGLTNLNHASVAELEELPGVGPAIAQAIIDHREQQGPFGSVEQLLDVRGIGEAKLEQLRDLVTV